jgi:hypothetical protein
LPKILFLALAPGLLIGAVLAPQPLAAQPHETTTYRIPAARGWRLNVDIDLFSGQMRCRLRAERMFVAAGAVAFQVGRRADVLDARIRIDDGEAILWRDMLPELARRRVAIGGRDVATPTDGLVWLPADMLRNAAEVAIQSGFGRRARKFRLEGFSASYDKALAKGCPPGERRDR